MTTPTPKRKIGPLEIIAVVVAIAVGGSLLLAFMMLLAYPWLTLAGVFSACFHSTDTASVGGPAYAVVIGFILNGIILAGIALYGLDVLFPEMLAEPKPQPQEEVKPS